MQCGLRLSNIRELLFRVGLKSVAITESTHGMLNSVKVRKKRTVVGVHNQAVKWRAYHSHGKNAVVIHFSMCPYVCQNPECRTSNIWGFIHSIHITKENIRKLNY